MKNWRYINGAECVKIGNYGVSLDSAGARQVREMAAKLWTSGMHNSRDIAMAIAFEIAKTSKAMQENKADVVSNIQDMVDRWIKEVKTGNKTVKYTSKSDSKKEFLYDEETGDLEVWYDGKKVDSLKNAGEGWKKYIETHATKTGNDTLAEYAKRPPKIVGGNKKCGNTFSKGQVLGEEGSKKYVFGGEINGTYIVYRQPDGGTYSFSSEQEIKDWLRASKIGNTESQELEKDVEKKDKEKVDDIEELKKTGNETYQHKLYPDKYVIIEGKNYKIVTDGKVEKSGELTDAVLCGINQIYKKVGNAKDKNDKDIKVGDFVNVTGKKGKVTKIIGDVVEVFFDNSGTYYPDRTDRYYASECTKVVNSIGGGVQSETVLTEAKDGSQYWVEKTSKSGQYAQYNLYYTIGQGKRHAGVFKDKEAAADAGRRIIGNVASEYEILKQDPSKMHPMYKKAYEEAMKKLAKEDEEFKKRFEKDYGVKAKNEASDDKFAYVMREFEEGKLKTPDGKVVTDPAQAKAIAYSESKKTENGLARARNAMAKNKKVKNSAVREYKHTDGRVAQIDFNEDGSDADMSIYDGSKEIEQRNFSTIRDAEQYVTSHGFRRI